MGIIDIVLIVCFLPCLYFGLRHGLVKQVISLCTIYFGISLSLRFSVPVMEWLSEHMTISPTVAKIASFVVIFVVIATLLALFGRLVEKVLQITLLGWLNRLLGVVMACLIFTVALSAVVFLVDEANNAFSFIPQEHISESRLYPALLKISKVIFPYFKQIF